MPQGGPNSPIIVKMKSCVEIVSSVVSHKEGLTISNDTKC